MLRMRKKSVQKNVCLKYLGCRRCFHVHASNSAQELLHCDLFLSVVCRFSVVYFSV